MRASGVTEPRVKKEGNTPEGSGSNAEASIDQEDPNILRPNELSHIEFGESIVKLEDLDVLKRLGYIIEKEDDMIMFPGSETIPESKDDEVVVFRSFSWDCFVFQCMK
jgi:hypothetical protein